MRNTENEKRLMAFFGEMEATDIDGVVAAYKKYMHSGGVWKNSGFPDMVGHDAIEHLLRQQQKLFDFQSVKVLDHRLLTSADNVVFFERRDSCVNSKGEVVYAFDILGKFVFEDGKIVEWADYMDTSTFTKALGGADWAVK